MEFRIWLETFDKGYDTPEQLEKAIGPYRVGQRVTAYKVMPVDEEGRIRSGMMRGRVDTSGFTQWATVSMPGKGIYMSLGKNFVLDYYSGLADNEVLGTFEFDPGDLTRGNLTDRETDFSVSSAKIVKIQKMTGGERP